MAAGMYCITCVSQGAVNSCLWVLFQTMHQTVTANLEAPECVWQLDMLLTLHEQCRELQQGGIWQRGLMTKGQQEKRCAVTKPVSHSAQDVSSYASCSVTVHRIIMWLKHRNVPAKLRNAVRSAGCAALQTRKRLQSPEGQKLFQGPAQRQKPCKGPEPRSQKPKHPPCP